MFRLPPISTLFPYTTLFRSVLDLRFRERLIDGVDRSAGDARFVQRRDPIGARTLPGDGGKSSIRSEEHTSELQSLTNLVCRLLLEKKKTSSTTMTSQRDATQ